MAKVTGMKLTWKPYSKIETNLGIDPNGPVHAFFTETCYRYMDKYVPMSDLPSQGSLREQVDLGINYIKYNMPYASYQYKGQREDGSHKVLHYTTPGTGPYWDKRMWSADKEQVIKEVQNYVDRGGK